MHQVLVLAKEASDRTLIEEVCTQAGMACATLSAPLPLLQRLEESRPDLLVMDDRFPGTETVALLPGLKRAYPGMEVVILADDYDPRAAARTVQSGAADCWAKPYAISRILERLAACGERGRRQSRGSFSRGDGFFGMAGRDSRMLEMFSLMERLGPHLSNAVIEGEPGTGKKLAARVLHRLSVRRDGPVVLAQCSQWSEDAELDPRLLLASASGGTLVLDSVEDLPATAQEKLAMVLENRAWHRGPEDAEGFECAIIALSRTSLSSRMSEGMFRRDLWLLLSAAEIAIPPLRERPEDVVLLSQRLLERSNGWHREGSTRITAPARSILESYSWPGNVAQLEDVLQRASMMAGNRPVESKDLPEIVRNAPAAGNSRHASIEEMECQHIREVLACPEMPLSQAARVLGISRSSLYRKISRYRIAPPRQEKRNGHAKKEKRGVLI